MAMNDIPRFTCRRNAMDPAMNRGLLNGHESASGASRQPPPHLTCTFTLLFFFFFIFFGPLCHVALVVPRWSRNDRNGLDGLE
jgi:hypothetical protein